MGLAFGTDHLAFVTGDTAQTVDFYTRVMGWPLAGAFTGTEPDGRRFFISGFQADGFVLEFEEVDDRPGPRPQAPGFPHFGLDVGSHDEYERWKAHLEGCDIPYLEVRDDDLFFSDPNGVSFQLIVKDLDEPPADRAARAAQLLDEWLERT
jgi:catechol 2,3-dioxygenase-like lactoylglutathione lyase family enzyme